MLFEDKVTYDPGFDSIGRADAQRERILRRWQCTSLSSVWIPDRLLPNRNKSRHEWTQKTAFHMLQRYESQDFEGSFSVYSDSEPEKRKSSDSDMEEEYFHDYAGKLKDFPDAFDDLFSKQENNNYFDELLHSNEELTYETLNSSPSKFRSKTSDRLPGFSQNFTDSLDKGSYDIPVVDLANECSTGDLIAELSNECSTGDLIAESSNDCPVKDLVSESSAKYIDDKAPSESRSVGDEAVMLNENCSGSQENINVVEAEFIYAKKKSFDDACGKRTGTKKEKKNRSKSKNTMPLDCFWQTVDSDTIPQVDEFYESLMREKNNSLKPVEIARISEFPQLDDVCSSPKINHPLDSSNKTGAFEPVVETKPSIFSMDAEVKVEEQDAGVKILVIENIPEDVQEEMVVSLVSDYGQLKEMRRAGEFWIAEFWMSPDVELDWLISCFDDHQPFGAYSSVLHCYEKCS